MINFRTHQLKTNNRFRSFDLPKTMTTSLWCFPTYLSFTLPKKSLTTTASCLFLASLTSSSYAKTLLSRPVPSLTQSKFIAIPVIGTQTLPRHLAKSEDTAEIIGSKPAPLKTNYLLSQPLTVQEQLVRVFRPFEFDTSKPTPLMTQVNNATWHPEKAMDDETSIRLQVLLDWNHASPGPIDSAWGMNSAKAVRAFEKMHGLKVDGQVDNDVWRLLNKDNRDKRPALVTYTITKSDVRTRFRRTPSGYQAKARDWELSYQNIYEMFGERFHMNVNFLKRINKGIPFRAGNKITVVNIGKPNSEKVNRIKVDKRRNLLYAYNDKRIVATYPTTIGNRTPSSGRTYSMVGKVYMPTYKAETAEKRYILPPGPNSPVGVAWMALSKPTFGIHGSPYPEGISRQRSHGCVRLTNWDASELFATIEKGTPVSFK